MLNEFLTLNVFTFMMIMARVGTTFSLLPGFSAVYVSARIRLGFAFAVSFLLVPMLGPSMPAQPANPGDMLVLVTGEVFVGAFLGTLSRILIGALQTAGTLIALFASISNAFVQDPIADQQSSTIAGFLGSLGIVLIFAADLHHLMIRAMIDSYTLFEPGRTLVMGDFSMMVTRWVADSFALGLRLTAPFLVVAFVYYVGLGLLGRLMPVLPVFFFGLPVQITVQFWVLMIALSGIMLVFLERFQEQYGAFLKP